MLSPTFVPSLMPVLLLPLFHAPAQPHLPAGTTQPSSWPCCLNSSKPPLPVRQRAHREFPTLLFPQAGVTHDILSLPSNLADEIPGAASHTPTPYWCSMWNNLRKCSSSFTSPISELNLPLPHKNLWWPLRLFGCCSSFSQVGFDPVSCVCSCLPDTGCGWGPKQALPWRMWDIAFIPLFRSQERAVSKSTTHNIKPKAEGLCDIWQYCDPQHSPRKEFCNEATPLPTGAKWKSPGAAVNIPTYFTVFFFPLFSFFFPPASVLTSTFKTGNLRIWKACNWQWFSHPALIQLHVSTSCSVHSQLVPQATERGRHWRVKPQTQAAQPTCQSTTLLQNEETSPHHCTVAVNHMGQKDTEASTNFTDTGFYWECKFTI